MKITNEFKKAIMTNAWMFARQGANKFGGKAVEYLSEAMKQAWELMYQQIAEFQAMQAKKEAEKAFNKNSIKIASWFVSKTFNLKMHFNPNCNEVVKETEKAVLVELYPADEFESIQQWVPKSCLV